MRGKNVRTLSLKVLRFNALVADFYVSSTESEKDGSVRRHACLKRGYDQLSQCWRAEFLKSSTVWARFNRMHRLYRSALNAYRWTSVKHRPWWGSGNARSVSDLKQNCVSYIPLIKLRYVLLSGVCRMWREWMIKVRGKLSRELWLVQWLLHWVATKSRESMLKVIFKRRRNHGKKQFLGCHGYVECSLDIRPTRTVLILK